MEECLRRWPGDKFVGCRIAKPFGGKTKTWFYGTVENYNYHKRNKEKSWQVKYDDGDAEKMNSKFYVGAFIVLFVVLLNGILKNMKRFREKRKNRLS